MHRVTSLLLASLLFACADKPAEQPAEPPNDEPKAEEKIADPNEAPPDPAGLRENCDFEVEDKCFTDKDAACEAAGCTPENCIVFETYPGQIQCSS